MKKFSKLLLVMLAVALLATTIFSTLGSAVSSENETALIGEADALGIHRKVEDFTGEEILIQDNVIPGEKYAETFNKNSVADGFVIRDANTSNKYGKFATVDSSSGNRYAKLTYEKGYKASGASYRSGIGIQDKQAFAKNDYLIYEWDMTTETQYPTNFTAFFLNTTNTSIGDRVKLFTFNEAGDKLIAGGQEYDLGAAGTWHHFTVVISLVANGTDYTGSLGALYLDGKKIADFAPVGNKGRAFSLRLLLGYYDQARENVADNATVCVDNVVSTSVPVGHKTAGEDKLAPLFSAQNPVTDLTLVGSNELVYNANYEVPFEPTVASYRADGTLKFYKDFAEAYAEYKVGDFQWIELYESAEGAIDAPVVIKVGEGITFTDTNAAQTDAYPCIEATAANGAIYKTYTKSEGTLKVRFFGGRKGTSDAEVAQLEVPFSVGAIVTIPEEFAPIQFSANPENRTKVFEATDKVEIYVNDALQTEMPLIREAMLDSATVEIYPVYELKDVAIEVVAVVDEVEIAQYYTVGSALPEAVQNAPDGAVITVRKNAGISSKVEVSGKTVTIDLAGKALYQTGDNAVFTPFEVVDGTLNLYSSATGAVVYCGKSLAAQAMLTVSGDAGSTVRIGYANDEATDAYIGNLTIHTPTVVKVSAAANVTIVGTEIKVVEAASATNGIVELKGATCQGAVVTLEKVNVYNTYKENNVISYSGVGENNQVILKDTVVYAPAKTESDGKGFINIVNSTTDVSTQSVVLDGFTYYGTLSGASVGETGEVNVLVEGAVSAVAVDRQTIITPDGVLFLKNNQAVDFTQFKYVLGGAYANSVSTIAGLATPVIRESIAVNQEATDFCNVKWFFYEGENGIVEELWVRGVTPEYLGTIPVSPECITYTFEGVTIGAIPDGATEMNVVATEVVKLELLMLKQSIDIIVGMDFKLYIPKDVPLSAVVLGDTTIEVADIAVDGLYYVLTIGEFTFDDIATANFAFTLKLTSARQCEHFVEAEANVLNYFEAIYEDETLKVAEQRMVTAFLKYVKSASEYLGINTDAITELLAGKVSNYYVVEGLAETGVLRNAVKGVRMSLVELPAYVFYLREAFSGTITIGDVSYTVENGVADGKNYILYTPASYAKLGESVSFTIEGTLTDESVSGNGKFALTNYLLGVREQLQETPKYILDLYQFYAIAKVVGEMRAEQEMPY